MRSRSGITNFRALMAVCGMLGYLAGQALIAAAPPQRGFDTPRQAADALIQAAQAYDVQALENILGPHSADLVASRDAVRDKQRAAAFAAKAREKESVALDPADPRRFRVLVGDEDWPLPIPIVMRNGKWYFDTNAGREEILARRIGENELDAITICRGFVEAEKEYAAESPNHQYAERIISTPGKRDGLYWENADGTPGGPISKAVAKAIAEGYSPSKRTPYHGYYFKVLKGQGPAAPLGELDFMVGGAMIGGFALVAVPAEYRVTGVKTFIVSHDGTVYQKDLGPNSLKIVQGMERYNPDKTWQRTDADW